MKRRSRRLAFHLTPLLDLLLIVIFAQFLEVRDDTQRLSAQVVAARESVAETVEERTAALTAERDAFRQAAADAERRATAAKKSVAELDAEHAARVQGLQAHELELAARLEKAIEQQQRAGEVVREAFRLPDDVLEKLFAPHDAAAARSPEDLERLKRAMQEMAAQRGRDVIKHVLTYEELRKRCDIWEVHVRANDSILLIAGDRTHEFRAASANEFAARLFDRYKSLPQPKSLVIMLLSYGDATIGTLKAALDGLPIAADRMRTDSNGRTRFEYAVLGFDPDGPLSPTPE